MSSVSLISGTTKPYSRANLRRILATREAISSCDASERGAQLLAEAELDLDRLQLLLDRGARLGLGLLLLRRLSRRLLRARPWRCGGEWRCRRRPSGRRASRTAGKAGPERRRASTIRSGRQKERVRIAAELAEHRLFGRAARAALGDQQARGERDDERGNLRDEAVADRKLGEDVGGGARGSARAA